jgi:nucleoside-diphosphate-sugar epimerase
MRILLTGATGFVGSEVLNQLLHSSAVSQVTCLTRRPLTVASSKLDEILRSDFSRYDDSLARRLAQHSGCIWALGGKASDIPAEYARVTHTFTVACARAIASCANVNFSFCYLSGMGADPTESTRVPWEKLTRHLKGRTERDLAEITQANPQFAVRSFRPGGILPRGSNGLAKWILAGVSIGVEQLARAMILEACRGDSRGYQVIKNSAIKELALTKTGAV